MAESLKTFKKEQIEIAEKRLAKADYPKELIIVAEGDSWFDYPLKKDILDYLIKKGYAIKKLAKGGDSLENMIYGSDYTIVGEDVIHVGPQSLQVTLNAVRSHHPKFVLFSGGGNDIVGNEIIGFLNHKNARNGSLVNKPIFQEKLLRMKDALVFFIEAIHNTFAGCHIIMHGYDYAKINGKGYSFILKNLKGPWILPSMGQKAITTKTEQNEIIKYLVDEFNSMLALLDQTYPFFHHIDLRGQFPNDNEWDNEIHLKNSGYSTVADIFHAKIEEILAFNPLDAFADEIIAM